VRCRRFVTEERVCHACASADELPPAPRSAAATVLYLHGGAFCTCSSSTHRALLSELVLKTGAQARAALRTLSAAVL